VARIVRQQIEAGIDIVSDGETSKLSFVSYIGQRLSGYELSPERRPGGWTGSKESEEFPDFYNARIGEGRPVRICRGPVAYVGRTQLEEDLRNLKDAICGAGVKAFVPSPTPGSVEGFWPRNEYYQSDEEYAYAIGEALREEYKAIIEAGFCLQVDDPWLLLNYALHPDWTVADTRKWAESRVAVLNHALRGIPEERVRHHTCYGINMGPRAHDLEFRHMIDLVLKVNAGAYSFEAANPRHEHEWVLWKNAGLPQHKKIIPASPGSLPTLHGWWSTRSWLRSAWNVSSL
jgi:5-methyltetrahydropteroyltriglutamate--homocysteine methyltransferase